MKLKSIVIAVCCLFLLGVSANVFAVNDSTGEALTSNVDILSASVVTSDDNGPSEPPNYAHLGVKMNTGSHLPAVLIFDFDVDNDTATGSGSVVTSLPSRQCGNAPCKADAGGGFDFYVALTLRTQSSPTAAFANCSGCSGGTTNCALRGAPGVGCNEGDCYHLGESCVAGDPDCYETSGTCTGCSDGTSYVMNVPCGSGDTPSCARGYIKGEWNAGFGQHGRIMNGNFNIPYDFSAIEEGDLCVEIPWGLILLQAHSKIVDAADPGHLPFDDVAARNNPPKFQVEALFDTGLPFDGDDFTQAYPPGTGFNLAIRDWMPDTDRVADGEFNSFDPCLHNSEGGYGDLDVDANDVTDFLKEFGRGGFNKPCPNCKN